MRHRRGSRGARLAPHCSAKRRSRGVALLMTMFLIAIMGIMLTVAGRVWRTEMQREKEAELLVVGQEIARAITRYHSTSLQYPQTLEQLLLDPNQQNTVRHLRRLYRDPITGDKKWGLIKDINGRITGVYSLGKGVPLKQAGFDAARAKFKGAQTYADWTFLAEAGNLAQGAMPGTLPGQGGSPNGPPNGPPLSPPIFPVPPTN